MSEDTPIHGTLNNVIKIDDERIKGHLDRIVRGTVEETLNIRDEVIWIVTAWHGSRNTEDKPKRQL